MGETLKHFSRHLKRVLFFSLAVLLALVIAVVLLPFILVFTILLTLFTSILIARRRRPRKKGEIEILPAEKSDFKSTSDVDLEITIDALQRKSGKQIDTKKPSDLT